jgi:hypothetical protein
MILRMTFRLQLTEQKCIGRFRTFSHILGDITFCHILGDTTFSHTGRPHSVTYWETSKPEEREGKQMKMKECGKTEEAGQLPALQTLQNETDARHTNLPNCSSASSAVSDLYRWMGWNLYHSWSGNASMAPSDACVKT